MSEPTTISDAGTPPIMTLTTPPSLTNPVPVIITTVPGHEPLAVTTAGTAAFPPIQLEMVTAPAEPVEASPSATSTERQNAVLRKILVEALLPTRRILPPPYRLATGSEL